MKSKPHEAAVQAPASQPSYHIAVVEDDAVIAEAIQKWLRELGHEASIFGTGEELFQSLPLTRFSLYVLDWGLPGISGLRVLSELRAGKAIDAPVLFCTSRDAETDVVEALAAGADDFIVKPIRKQELAARVAAALRRSYPPQPETGKLQYGAYSIDLNSRQISLKGQPVDLQNREYELALMLFRHVNGVVPREKIIHSLWGNVPLDGSRSLDTHVSRIRRKLDISPANGYALQSVYGRGYRLQALTL
ncbi:MAG TPA: response regulator transcription factor [Usitatibacteraceae bacterium]|nr:response regulator transcription factor [Usitatibacteraceae bacterium]